jgi:hypothetical protein
VTTAGSGRVPPGQRAGPPPGQAERWRRAAPTATPRAAATAIEAAPRLPASEWDRFTGYGVLGVGFASGHTLALRRIPASSIGPAFTTVWHRDDVGRWTFYVDGQPELTCTRYFGPAGQVRREDVIALAWHGATSFTVRVPGPGIAWAVHLAPAPGARALGALRRQLPESIRRRAGVQRAMAAAASRLLRLDSLTVSGRAPSGHGFRLDTHEFWVVDATTARCGGQHLGPPITQRTRVGLGDFFIPAWGVFTTGDAFFEPDSREP